MLSAFHSHIRHFETQRVFFEDALKTSTKEAATIPSFIYDDDSAQKRNVNVRKLSESVRPFWLRIVWTKQTIDFSEDLLLEVLIERTLLDAVSWLPRDLQLICCRYATVSVDAQALFFSLCVYPRESCKLSHVMEHISVLPSDDIIACRETLLNLRPKFAALEKDMQQLRIAIYARPEIRPSDQRSSSCIIS